MEIPLGKIPFIEENGENSEPRHIKLDVKPEKICKYYFDKIEEESLDIKQEDDEDIDSDGLEIDESDLASPEYQNSNKEITNNDTIDEKTKNVDSGTNYQLGTIASYKSIVNYIRVHYGTISESDELTYKCDICNASKKDPRKFLMHDKVHSNIRRHKCEYCKMNFGLITSLFKHKLKAHPFRKIKCNIHKKGSGVTMLCCQRRKSDVVKTSKKRISTSTGGINLENNDSVEIEPKVIKMTDQLIDEITNLSNKKYVCLNCDQKFEYSLQLTAHMKIHSGEI